MRSTQTASAVLERFYFHNWMLSSWVFYYGFICVFMYICIYISQTHLYQLLKKNVISKLGVGVLFTGERAWQVQGTGRWPVKPENSDQDEARDLGSFQASLTMLGSFEGKMFCLHPEALADFWRIISMSETGCSGSGTESRPCLNYLSLTLCWELLLKN